MAVIPEGEAGNQGQEKMQDVTGIQEASPVNRISVLITTRNRKDALLTALESLVAQEGLELEIIVLDDASDDGTCEAVGKKFPGVNLISNDIRKERLILRNEGVRLARNEYVLILDDDCYLTDEKTLENAVKVFSSDDTIAVSCLPVVEPYRNRPSLSHGPITVPGGEVGRFLAGASIFKRSAYLEVGGYRELLVHHHEERDLAVRLMDKGYKFVYAGGPYVVHTIHPSRNRNEQLAGYLRNMVLVPFLNYPMKYALMHMFGGSFKVLTVSFKGEGFARKCSGIVSGWKSCITFRKYRKPVSPATYRKFRKLPAHGPEFLSEPVKPPCNANTESS